MGYRHRLLKKDARRYPILAVSLFARKEKECSLILLIGDFNKLEGELKFTFHMLIIVPIKQT